MQLSPPQTQKAEDRPIAFVLDDTTSGNTPVVANLTVRPEDLTRSDPSRMVTHQTLGGAWVDNFGEGISTLTISGHTGWRRRISNNVQRDGAESFRYLYDHVYTKWHERRRDAIKAGLDPDRVRLVYADALDDFAVVVAPVSFVLRRSKSSPLLFRYQIVLTVVSRDIDDLSYLQLALNSAPSAVSEVEYAGLDSMAASTASLTSYLADIQNFVDHALVAPVRDYLIKSIALYNHVADAVRAGDDIAASLIAVAHMTAAAGMNVFRTIGAVANLPSHVSMRLAQVASAYSNIFCVLRNALRQQEFYPDYNPLFGSSNCSSTSGGRPLSPLSGVNPFYLYSPTNRSLPISLNDSAQTGLRLMASSDVVLAPMSQASLSNTISNISSGMSVA